MAAESASEFAGICAHTRPEENTTQSEIASPILKRVEIIAASGLSKSRTWARVAMRPALSRKKLPRLFVVNHDLPLAAALRQNPGEQAFPQHAARRGRVGHKPVDVHRNEVGSEKPHAPHGVGRV